MKKRLMMVLAAGALVAAMLPGVVSAGEFAPGRLGQPEVDAITINAQTNNCNAHYAVTVEMRHVDQRR